MPKDFWMRASKKGIVVFALPRECGLTELTGDFKIQFHDRQGDYYWHEVLVVGLRRYSRKRDTTNVGRSDALERNLTNGIGIR
ncbi:hypothetical protein Tco_0149180 [Tanacetum coccineum]